MLNEKVRCEKRQMIPKNKYLSWKDRKKKINRSVERKREREREIRTGTLIWKQNSVDREEERLRKSEDRQVTQFCVRERKRE